MGPRYRNRRALHVQDCFRGRELGDAVPSAPAQMGRGVDLETGPGECGHWHIMKTAPGGVSNVRDPPQATAPPWDQVMPEVRVELTQGLPRGF